MRTSVSGAAWGQFRAYAVGCVVGTVLLGTGCGEPDGPGPPTCASTPSAIASYPFTGNADDSSGNRNHGTVSGATLTADRFGNVGSAYSFDGFDDVITIGAGVQPPFPFTVSLWFNASELRFAHVFSNDDVNDAANRWGVGMLIGEAGTVGSNSYEGFSAPWNRVSYWATAESLFEPDEWHHFAIVFNANDDREIYFNGSAMPGEYSGTGSSMQYAGGSGMIGRVHGNSVPKFQFRGSLDDIQVFGAALSSDQIQQLFTQDDGCL